MRSPSFVATPVADTIPACGGAFAWCWLAQTPVSNPTTVGVVTGMAPTRVSATDTVAADTVVAPIRTPKTAARAARKKRHHHVLAVGCGLVTGPVSPLRLVVVGFDTGRAERAPRAGRLPFLAAQGRRSAGFPLGGCRRGRAGSFRNAIGVRDLRSGERSTGE